MTKQNRPLFVYGTLMDEDVLRFVSGMNLPELYFQPAVVKGFQRRLVKGESFPVLVQQWASQEMEAVSGLLIEGLSNDALLRVQFFEGDEYHLQNIEAEYMPDSHSSMVKEGNTVAEFFAGSHSYEVDEKDWSIRSWQAREKAEFIPRLENYMSYFGRLSASEADKHW